MCWRELVAKFENLPENLQPSDPGRATLFTALMTVVSEPAGTRHPKIHVTKVRAHGESLDPRSKRSTKSNGADCAASPSHTTLIITRSADWQPVYGIFPPAFGKFRSSSIPSVALRKSPGCQDMANGDGS